MLESLIKIDICRYLVIGIILLSAPNVSMAIDGHDQKKFEKGKDLIDRNAYEGISSLENLKAGIEPTP